jgi:hypothetical protein
MQKVRIDAPGWEGFSDLLGGVPFKNGVSERELTPQEVLRLGACIRLVKVENDEQVGASTVMASSRNVSASVEEPLQKASTDQRPEVEPKYSRDKLEEIASEGGIKAIREVAKEFDVKGVEINKMIDEVMKVQLGTEEEE